MVEKFEEIVKLINKGHSEPVTLFMILKMDEFQDKWSVVISAPWITDETKSDLFVYLRGLLLKRLSKEEMRTIARMGLFPERSHFTQLFLKNLEFQSIDNGFVRVQGRQVNGYKIHDAYIYALNRFEQKGKDPH